MVKKLPGNALTSDIRAWEKRAGMCTSDQCLRTMGLTDTAIHWTPVVLPPKRTLDSLPLEGLEADVVIKCIWEQLQAYLLLN